MQLYSKRLQTTESDRVGKVQFLVENFDIEPFEKFWKEFQQHHFRQIMADAVMQARREGHILLLIALGVKLLG